MNITFQTTNVNYQLQMPAIELSNERKAPSLAEPSEISSNYDKVTITKNQPRKILSDDSEFARILSRRCANALDREADTEKVFQLQNEVAAGAYRIDPERIAEKLLGYAKAIYSYINKGRQAGL